MEMWNIVQRQNKRSDQTKAFFRSFECWNLRHNRPQFPKPRRINDQEGIGEGKTIKITKQSRIRFLKCWNHGGKGT